MLSFKNYSEGFILIIFEGLDNIHFSFLSEDGSRMLTLYLRRSPFFRKENMIRLISIGYTVLANV